MDRNKKAFVLLLTMCGITLLFVGTNLTARFFDRTPVSFISKPCPVSSPSVVCPVSSSFLSEKQEIADTLVDLHRQLATLTRHNKPSTPQLLVKLEAIIERLDVKYKFSKMPVQSIRSPTRADKELTNKSDVCPEVYYGVKYGEPLNDKGWEITNCTNAKKLPEVITVLLNTILYPEGMEKQIFRALKGINRLYPGVQILTALTNAKILSDAENLHNVSIVKVSGSSTLGQAWNQLIEKVATPYTVIARDLVHFDFNAQLERQIRMTSEVEHVGVVGGAFRNLSGHWLIGCRQSRMKNYVLEFQEGYHYSRNACMFCDDLQGPFVARTHLLKLLKLKESGRAELVFVDFFLRVKNAGYLVMNCPDAMYFTLTYPHILNMETRKETWRSFATEWILERIMLSKSIEHVFTCKDIGYKCTPSTTRFALLPKCCLDEFGRAVKFFHEFAVRNNIKYELAAGLALGSMKFNSYSPFDVDGDIWVYSKNYSFIKKHTDEFEKNGFGISGFRLPIFDDKGRTAEGKNGAFVMWASGLYCDMSGADWMTGGFLLPEELRAPEFHTKILLSGSWVRTKFNPGLFSRNAYGREVLKHAQSYAHVPIGGPYGTYKVGTFLKCTKPGFHSCLDTFPGDGNLAFKGAC